MIEAAELVFDNFAGGSGASTGIREAIGRPVDVALNHDEWACAMYRANHPETLVLCQSVYKADPRDVVMEASRRRGYDRPLPVGAVWFSPDCTDHSKAKGAAPIRNRHSRDLAWVVVHWAKLVKPREIYLENVEEFTGWCPLRQRRWPDGRPMFDLHGNPVLERDPDRHGETFRRWVRELRKLGYVVEWRELRASDYGVPTIRKRLFLVARRDGKPIVWPAATHGRDLLPYRTAAECIDWSIPCRSIFGRKRPLAENTMRRIAAGIRRYVIESANPFIIPITHHGDARVHGIDEPLRTITTAPRGEHALITPFMVQRYGERDGQAPRCRSVEQPLPTVVTDNNGSTLVAAFLAKHYGGHETPGWPMPEPISTITTQDHHALVSSHLVKLKGTCKDGQPVTEPMPTVQAGGQHIGEVRAFLIKYYSEGGQSQALSEPMHTLTTKARLGLVTVAGIDYQIVDIGMRMLTPRELYRAQGFRDSFIIDPIHNGKPLTKTQQIEKCGNSVPPEMARVLVAANYDGPIGLQEVA